jgi:hypothetical protein
LLGKQEPQNYNVCSIKHKRCTQPTKIQMYMLRRDKHGIKITRVSKLTTWHLFLISNYIDCSSTYDYWSDKNLMYTPFGSKFTKSSVIHNETKIPHKHTREWKSNKLVYKLVHNNSKLQIVRVCVDSLSLH